MADPRVSNKPNIDFSKQKEAAVALRAKRRAAKAAEKDQQAEELKEKGNGYFHRKDYTTAVHYYTLAAQINGGQPACYMSNMAAAQLKLENFEEAEEAAHTALFYDSKSLKARYRRGLARKGNNLLHGAIIDFETVLAQDPANADALSQLTITRELFESGEGDETGYDTEGEQFPPLDAEKWEIDTESDSSDYQHDGNGIPCRFYNRDGCNKGNGPLGCKYRHSPDEKSSRDKLGRNVCLYYTIGICKFGDEKCNYAHDLTYLDAKRVMDEDQKAAVVKCLSDVKDTSRSLRPTGYKGTTNTIGQVEKRSHKKLDPRAHIIGPSNSPQDNTRGNDGHGRGGGRGKGKRAGRLSARQEREMEERTMNGGFTNDEMDELLCQGVKPWDDDAWDVLHALNDYY
ncbi:hypothetical protein BD410DRAFT_786568 [Rickenella mellea]|uniref:C3H1-type domain-containing protein n=1 Tax=Rickenella mellea TaxID=50990 RepID=A0A4Y7QAR1_9AGAM|nr:hypothetical protein BD410DRAFT_786568 [Rickenella mellea]